MSFFDHTDKCKKEIKIIQEKTFFFLQALTFFCLLLILFGYMFYKLLKFCRLSTYLFYFCLTDKIQRR